MLTSGDLLVGNLPHQIKNLAEALAKKHGTVVASRGERGIELQMASPIALIHDGAVELDKRHLYVNAERYLGIGQWHQKVGTYNADRSGWCMKYGKPFNVSDLLRMPPLESRGVNAGKSPSVVVGSIERKLIDNGKGNMVPPGPGEVVPILDLPEENPGVWYLKSRGYDLHILTDQFRCAWCTKELPVDRAMGIYWKKLSLGFKRTPQGRIIFFADIGGVRQGYQARIPEAKEDGHKFYWHPYLGEWTHCEDWDEVSQKWLPSPEVKRSPLGWDIAKYMTGPHVARSQILLGLDAAIRWNHDFRIEQPVTIVTEGPLDAARWGPPAVAQLGKYLSPQQADLLAQNFSRVIYVMDDDTAGNVARKRVVTQLKGRVKLITPTLPEWNSETNQRVKDPGDLAPAQAWDLVGKYIWQ